MRAKFNQSFKIQAVEKALNRSEETGLRDVANSLGVALSTLHKWLKQSKAQQFESANNEGNFNQMTKEKRPQDWSQEDKLKIVIACDSLDENAISERCRQQGIYPHHIKQWKNDFACKSQPHNQAKKLNEMKALKQEVKNLKRELNRKDKALAETAALLVLQKKSTQSGETTRTAYDD